MPDPSSRQPASPHPLVWAVFIPWQACTDLDTLTQQATLTSSATAEADAKAQINNTIARRGGSSLLQSIYRVRFRIALIGCC